MRSEKNILKNAKEAYELLLELYCDLCQTEDLEQSKAILTEVVSVIEKIKQYKFFPLSISPSIEASIRKEENITNNERLSIIQELYERLASLLFRFEEANIDSMRPYINVLEYGRSYIPFHISRHWGKEYRTSPRSINESFYFHYVSRFYPQSKQEYQFGDQN